MSSKKRTTRATEATATAAVVDGTPSATPEVAAAPPAAEKPAKPVAVIQNGVRQPKEGGLCRAVWDFCASQETLPTAAQVKEHAVKVGWNPNNASIEYYQYRKFTGVRGRQGGKVASAAPAATE